MEILQLEYIRIDQLKETEGNPKLHDIGGTYEAIMEYGFKVPLICNSVVDGKYQIVAGHGRTETLVHAMSLHAQGKGELPRGIKLDDDGMFMAPVILGLDLETEAEVYAFLLDDNNLTAMGGDFTALDVSRMYDRTAYIEALKKTAGKAKTVDQTDLQLLIKIDRADREEEPEPLFESDKGEEPEAIRYVVTFSTQNQKDEFIDWLQTLRELSPGTMSGDLLVENLT